MACIIVSINCLSSTMDTNPLFEVNESDIECMQRELSRLQRENDSLKRAGSNSNAPAADHVNSGDDIAKILHDAKLAKAKAMLAEANAELEVQTKKGKAELELQIAESEAELAATRDALQSSEVKELLKKSIVDKLTAKFAAPAPTATNCFDGWEWATEDLRQNRRFKRM